MSTTAILMMFYATGETHLQAAAHVFGPVSQSHRHLLCLIKNANAVTHWQAAAHTSLVCTSRWSRLDKGFR